MVYIVLVVLMFGVGILAINVYQLNILQQENKFMRQTIPSVEARSDHTSEMRENIQSNPSFIQKFQPRVWIHGRNLESGYLNHVFRVFRRVGFNYGYAHTEWDVLWAHDYPFTELQDILRDLRPSQKVDTSFIKKNNTGSTSFLFHTWLSTLNTIEIIIRIHLNNLK